MILMTWRAETPAAVRMTAQLSFAITVATSALGVDRRLEFVSSRVKSGDHNHDLKSASRSAAEGAAFSCGRRDRHAWQPSEGGDRFESDATGAQQKHARRRGY